LVNALLVRVEEMCKLNKAPEITISIAKEAASVMPDREGSDIVIENERVVKEKALRVANG
jgi:hypothetical protein